MKTAELSINDLQNMANTVQEIAPKLEFKTRMAFAEIGRICQREIKKFQGSIDKVDLQNFNEARTAAKEKYKADKDPSAMESFTKELAVLERKYKTKLDRATALEKQLMIEADTTLSIALPTIAPEILDKKEIHQFHIETLLPIIEQA